MLEWPVVHNLSLNMLINLQKTNKTSNHYYHQIKENTKWRKKLKKGGWRKGLIWSARCRETHPYCVSIRDSMSKMSGWREGSCVRAITILQAFQEARTQASSNGGFWISKAWLFSCKPSAAAAWSGFSQAVSSATFKPIEVRSVVKLKIPQIKSQNRLATI